MSANTNIEWCDHTFNPWIGCTKVGPGCDHCYAETLMDHRMHKVQWGPKGERVRTSSKNWNDPVRWNAQADAFTAQHGRRQRVFCASLADVFDNAVPVQWRRDLFDLIATTPNLDWLLLTKRIGSARSLYAGAYLDSARPWPAHIWLGATITSQEEADRDIPKLLAVPARGRFLSMEPLLGPVDLTELQPPGIERVWLDSLRGRAAPLGGSQPSSPTARIDWVIAGGESGPGARPMHPGWARDLRDQCAAAGVPFLFKQWGEWTPGENVDRKRGTVDTAYLEDDGWHIFKENLATADGHIDDEPDLYRIGKKDAGRLLDGCTYDGFPT